MTDVECDGCTACCRHQLVVLMDEDLPNLAVYAYHEIDMDGTPVRMLKNRPNGDCSHLGPAGCTIYDQRPEVCRAYDCRKQFKIMPRNDRRQVRSQAIWRAARERLGTLDAEDLAELGRYRSRASAAYVSVAG